MRTTTYLIAIAVLTAATTGTLAASKDPMGATPACKAPWGEPFGLGETIDLHVTDAKGNIVKVTYQCTTNGWVKVSKAALAGGALPLATSLMRRSR